MKTMLCDSDVLGSSNHTVLHTALVRTLCIGSEMDHLLQLGA